MLYEENFTNAELEKIIEEGAIYMCACPAQVADAIRKVRELYHYQLQCLNDPSNESAVHQAIGCSAIRVHAELQSCMERVLELEAWDRATLTMPPHLRCKQVHSLQAEETPLPPDDGPPHPPLCRP
jgi:hypothetical protein